VARKPRTHLKAPDRASLCAQGMLPPGDETTEDIVQADCRSCLWTLAKVTHMQMAGALKRIEQLEGVEVIDGPPPRTARRV